MRILLSGIVILQLPICIDTTAQQSNWADLFSPHLPTGRQGDAEKHRLYIYTERIASYEKTKHFLKLEGL